ncbi:MAG: DinB family protein [Candidatus Heimdallarchaeota archaeon]|nr:MAG: DinB family protein [Candidatus Heimdallarchaeota archaeon]
MSIEESEVISKAFQEQYGAAIEMLEQVIKKCPEEIWDDRTSGPPFWQVVYHTLWYLDWYLGKSKEERKTFKPRFVDESFENLKELPKGILTSEQLHSYLSDIKKKGKHRLEQLTLEEIVKPSVFEWHGSSIHSSLIYNIRHVMLHIGALNSRLLRKGIKLDNWVSHAPILPNQR